MAERRKPNSELNDRLDVIEGQLSQLLLYEAARQEREKNTEKVLSKLKETVDGNGKTGLKENFDKMNSTVTILKANDEKRDATNRTIFAAIIIQIFLLVLSRIF